MKSISPQSNIYSSPARLEFQTGPAPVRSLFGLERGSDYIRLGWEEVPNAVEYAIYYYAKASFEVSFKFYNVKFTCFSGLTQRRKLF